MIGNLTRQPDRAAPWRLVALCLAMLLPSLGTSIANVALPTLAASFGASFQAVQWVVLSYLLAVTTLIVGAGSLGDMLGRRRLLLAGIGIFALASVICAGATSLWLLVAARGVQGVGAAIMMALTVASVGDMVGKERTGRAMGLLATVSAVGTALGPSLGGALIAWFGWPAVFAVMAGAGGVTFLLAFRVFPAEPARGRKRFSFDIAGMLLLALSLAAYAMAMTAGATAATIALLAAVSAISLAAFVAQQARTATPLVQLALLRDRSLSAGLLAMALVSAILMATLVVGPFYLAGVLGLGPVETGLVMSTGPGVVAVMGVPAGRLADRFGSSPVGLAGLTGVAAGALLLTLLPGMFGIGGYIAGLAVVTAGYALFQTANTTSVMNAAAQDRRGVTSALLGLARNLGLITGASAMGAVFAFGSRGVAGLGLGAGGGTGLQVTFGVATVLAGFALAIAVWGRSSDGAR